MKLGGSSSDTLASKAHSFGIGCGLSGTVTIVCWSTNKLDASTRACCFFSHRKGIKQWEIWLQQQYSYAQNSRSHLHGSWSRNWTKQPASLSRMTLLHCIDDQCSWLQPPQLETTCTTIQNDSTALHRWPAWSTSTTAAWPILFYLAGSWNLSPHIPTHISFSMAPKKTIKKNTPTVGPMGPVFHPFNSWKWNFQL